MAFIGSILGAGQGSDWVAPTDYNQSIVNPVTPAQTDAAYAQTQQGLQYQNDFVKATQAQQGLANQSAALNAQQGLQSQLAAQNGAGNQSSVFNQQQSIADALAAQNGIGKQQQAFQAQAALAQQQQGLIAQQQGLAGQLQGVANGTGPNPAQAMLAQQTGNNVANQAALMAGQRGASANAGLIARQAAMQGANIQQQAVGQGATLQAQQSLGAMGQLQGQQQAIGNTQQAIGQTNNALAGIGSAQLQAQQAQQAQLAGLSSQQVQQQAAQNQAVAGLATQQVAQQQNATMGYNQAAQSQQQNLFGAIGNANNAQAAIQSAQNRANADIQVQNSEAQQGIFGGILGGAGSILAGGGMVEGNPSGEPEKPKDQPGDNRRLFAGGGPTGSAADTAPMSFSAPPIQNPVPGPSSAAGRFLFGSAPDVAGGTPMMGGAGGMGGGNKGSQGMNAGANQVVSKVLNKYVVPAVKDAFGPGVDPNGLGAAQFNSAPAPTLGVEGIAAPIDPAAAGLGVDTMLPATGIPADGYGAFEGAEALGALEGAEAVGAVEGASAVEGGAAAAEGASAMEGSASALALLAKGGKVGSKNTKVPPAKMDTKDALKKGGKVPGKPAVKGDSYKNDTVKALLSPGEVVIPRSVMTSADPVGNAARFVQAVLAKQNMRKPGR